MSRRRSSNKNRQDVKGLVIILICSIVLLSLGWVIYAQKINFIGRDSVNQCRDDGYVSQETVLIFDATDSFSKTQAILLKNKIEKLVAESPVDERFTFYVLGDEEQQFKPALMVCNPGDGSNKSELTHNIRRLQKQWEVNFYQKVATEVDKLTGEHKASASPIMEMIKFASVQSLAPSNAALKKLILVSDMIHHTERFSHYKNKAAFNNIKNSPYIKHLQSHLAGTEVEIMYVSREKDMPIQTRQHILFWENYIAASGGQIIKVERIN